MSTCSNWQSLESHLQLWRSVGAAEVWRPFLTTKLQEPITRFCEKISKSLQSKSCFIESCLSFCFTLRCISEVYVGNFDMSKLHMSISPYRVQSGGGFLLQSYPRISQGFKWYAVALCTMSGTKVMISLSLQISNVSRLKNRVSRCQSQKSSTLGWSLTIK